MPMQFAHSDTDGDESGDHFEYRVGMWAITEKTEGRALKQSPTLWSG